MERSGDALQRKVCLFGVGPWTGYALSATLAQPGGNWWNFSLSEPISQPIAHREK
jgi:hypothetical protein